MVNPELMKLIGILVGGAIIGGIGQVIILKKKKERKAKEFANSGSGDDFNSTITSPETSSLDNQDVISYIQQYKSQYDRNSIKGSIINYYKLSDSEAEAYVSKYF